MNLPDVLIARAKELDLKPEDKIKVQMSPDLIAEILLYAVISNTKYMELPDGSYVFWLNKVQQWSPKIHCVKGLPPGSIIMTKITGNESESGFSPR